jgi:hypothetical protein
MDYEFSIYLLPYLVLLLDPLWFCRPRWSRGYPVAPLSHFRGLDCGRLCWGLYIFFETKGLTVEEIADTLDLPHRKLRMSENKRATRIAEVDSMVHQEKMKYNMEVQTNNLNYILHTKYASCQSFWILTL